MLFVDCSAVPILGTPFPVDDHIVWTAYPIKVFHRFKPFIGTVFGLNHFQWTAWYVDQVAVQVGRAEAINDREDFFSLLNGM